jgi:hypothetical protein
MHIWEEWPQFFRGASPLLFRLRWGSELAVRARLIELAAGELDGVSPKEPQEDRVNGPDNLPRVALQDMSSFIRKTYRVENHAP